MSPSESLHAAVPLVYSSLLSTPPVVSLSTNPSLYTPFLLLQNDKLNHIPNLSPLSAFWRKPVKGVTVFSRPSYRHIFEPPFISTAPIPASFKRRAASPYPSTIRRISPGVASLGAVPVLYQEREEGPM